MTLPVGDEPLTVAVSLTVEPTTTEASELDKVVGESNTWFEAEAVEDEVELVVTIASMTIGDSIGRITMPLDVDIGVIVTAKSLDAAVAKVNAAEQEASSNTTTASTVNLLHDDARARRGGSLLNE